MLKYGPKNEMIATLIQTKWLSMGQAIRVFYGN